MKFGRERDSLLNFQRWRRSLNECCWVVVLPHEIDAVGEAWSVRGGAKPQLVVAVDSERTNLARAAEGIDAGRQSPAVPGDEAAGAGVAHSGRA